MVRTYLLPCAGYDRPGGSVSRAVAEKLSDDVKDVIIGSMGALFMERPGELRDLRTSDVICIDGCGTKCSSELALARGRNDITVLSVPDIVGSVEDYGEKVRLMVEAGTSELNKRASKESSIVAEKPPLEIEYLEEKFDKFTLRVAKDFKYSDNDFWVLDEGDHVRVGVSDVLQQMMSDVYFVELVNPGTHVDMFDDAGAMESTKTMVEIIVPISGTIVESNRALEKSPELINESPYKRGWLYCIYPDDIDELELLRNAPDYMTHALAKAKNEIGKKVE